MADGKKDLWLFIRGKDVSGSKTLKGVGDAGETAGKKISGLKLAAGAVSAAAIVKFGTDSVRAYSEAQQSQAKLEDAYARFPALADENIEGLRELNSELAKKTRFDDDASAAASATLAQYKLTGTQIRELLPLVQDYAAKTGQDLTTAATTVGKALYGKGRALAQVGIQFKDAGSIEANYTQITQGLRAQVGGFAEKEGKTAAGQAQILSNQFGELQETVGAALVPALTSLVQVVTPVVEGFNALPEPVQVGAIAIGLLATAAIIAVPKVIAFQQAIASVGGAGGAGKMRGGLGGVTSFLGGPWGIAIGAGITALGMFALAHSQGKERVEGYTEALKADTGAIGENTRAHAYNSLEKSGAIRLARELGISSRDLIDATFGEGAALERVREAIRNRGFDGITLARQLGIERDAVSDAEAKHRDYKEAVDGGTSATKDATDASSANADVTEVAKYRTESWATTLERVERHQDDAAASVKRYTDRLDAWVDKVQTSRGTTRDWQAAVDDANESLKENGDTLNIGNARGRANAEALDRMVDAAQDVRQSMVDNQEPAKEINKQWKVMKDRIYDTAIEMGMSKTEAKKYVAQLGKIKPRYDTKATFTGVIRYKFKYGNQEYDLSQGEAIAVALGMGLPEVSVQKYTTPEGRATGGAIQGGTPYWVGEKGPEIVVPDGNGYVIPNHAIKGGGGTAAVMGGGPQVVQQFYGPVIGSKREFAVYARDAFRSTGIAPT